MNFIATVQRDVSWLHFFLKSIIRSVSSKTMGQYFTRHTQYAMSESIQTVTNPVHSEVLGGYTVQK